MELLKLRRHGKTLVLTNTSTKLLLPDRLGRRVMRMPYYLCRIAGEILLLLLSIDILIRHILNLLLYTFWL